MTQAERILRHLSDVGSITPLEALSEYGVYRLAAVVCKLRKDGIPIDSDTVHGKNRYGESTRYARYFIAS